MSTAARQPLYAIVFVLFINITSASFCDIIKQKYSPSERYVSQHGVPKNITLFWDSDLARAAAAQLSVVLRYALGYRHVRFQQIAANTPPESPCKENGILKEVRISMTTASVRHRLHLRLAKLFQDKAVCLNMDKLSSYTDDALISECGFGDSFASGRHIINVIQLNSKSQTMVDTVKQDLTKSGLPFVYKEINRTDLFQLFRSSKQSFFFIDYDMWAGAPDVSVVELPLHLNGLTTLRRQKLNSNIITTVGDRCLLEDYAPQLLVIAYKYAPSPNVLRPILEIENSSKDIEEAVCKMTTSRNFTSVNSLVGKYKPRKKNYVIMCIICDDDPDIDEYDELFFFLGMNRYKTSDSKFFIITRIMDLNCSDPEGVIRDINDYMLHNLTSSYIGILVGGLPNIAAITKILNVYNIPVIFYDSHSIDAPAIEAISTPIEKGSTSHMWVSTGRTLHLTLALQHLILKMGWNRIAVLSDPTRIAKRFIDDLIDRSNNLELREHRVRHNLTDVEADLFLQRIKAEDAKVILVNTDYKDAATILTAAVKLKMNMDKKLIWILREWRKNKKILNIKHFVISFWCKRGDDIHSTGTGRLDYLKKVDELWPRHVWPPQTAAFVNAVLTVVEGFDDVILKYPRAQDDTQTKQVIRQFERTLLEVPVKGLTQTLTYKRHMLEEAVVYVEEWHSYQRKFQVQMRVNATSHKVTIDYVRSREYFAQLLKDDEANDYKITTQTKLWYILWAFVTIVLILPLFAIILLHKHIHRRKETV
ncbi:unnamed protein product [Arctia plantaginis]|uniref:Receptor ligand binding region domain-containing protein n=1 Tax=Arctia plantaginis TaxID=874455 RepID=A0A8S1BP89_ARCPL|nr:unnamed protein product [Arctia plantaginis]CAB3260571.1 unnamed protein product [Arctia plantaginis]